MNSFKILINIVLNLLNHFHFTLKSLTKSGIKYKKPWYFFLIIIFFLLILNHANYKNAYSLDKNVKITVVDQSNNFLFQNKIKKTYFLPLDHYNQHNSKNLSNFLKSKPKHANDLNHIIFSVHSKIYNSSIELLKNYYFDKNIISDKNLYDISLKSMCSLIKDRCKFINTNSNKTSAIESDGYYQIYLDKTKNSNKNNVLIIPKIAKFLNKIAKNNSYNHNNSNKSNDRKNVNWLDSIANHLALHGIISRVFQNNNNNNNLKTNDFAHLKKIIKSFDSYTELLDKKQFSSYHQEAKGITTGLGFVLEMKDNKFTVSEVIKDSPAFNSGIEKNDVIIKINDTWSFNKSFDQLEKILQNNFSSIDITFLNPDIDKHYKKVTLIKKPIELAPISIDLIKTKNTHLNKASISKHNQKPSAILSIKINYFSENITKKIINFYQNKILNNQPNINIIGIILDLRNNSGGLLESAVDLVDLFISSGFIVSARKSNGLLPTYFAKNSILFDKNIPMLVLINENTASSAEIVAKALKHNHRSLTIGTPSYGKTSVQSLSELHDGYGLKLTIGHFKTKFHLPLQNSNKLEKKQYNILLIPDILMVDYDQYNYYDHTDTSAFNDLQINNKKILNTKIRPVFNSLKKIIYEKNLLKETPKIKNNKNKMVNNKFLYNFKTKKIKLDQRILPKNIYYYSSKSSTNSTNTKNIDIYKEFSRKYLISHDIYKKNSNNDNDHNINNDYNIKKNINDNGNNLIWLISQSDLSQTNNYKYNKTIIDFSTKFIDIFVKKQLFIAHIKKLNINWSMFDLNYQFAQNLTNKFNKLNLIKFAKANNSNIKYLNSNDAIINHSKFDFDIKISGIYKNSKFKNQNNYSNSNINSKNKSLQSGSEYTIKLNISNNSLQDGKNISIFAMDLYNENDLFKGQKSNIDQELLVGRIESGSSKSLTISFKTPNNLNKIDHFNLAFLVMKNHIKPESMALIASFDIKEKNYSSLKISSTFANFKQKKLLKKQAIANDQNLSEIVSEIQITLTNDSDIICNIKKLELINLSGKQIKLKKTDKQITSNFKLMPRQNLSLSFDVLSNSNTELKNNKLPVGIKIISDDLKTSIYDQITLIAKNSNKIQ